MGGTEDLGKESEVTVRRQAQPGARKRPRARRSPASPGARGTPALQAHGHEPSPPSTRPRAGPQELGRHGRQRGPSWRSPGVSGAAGPFSPAVSTMLPSVCTTISVAFSVFRLSPICRAVLPDWREERASGTRQAHLRGGAWSCHAVLAVAKRTPAAPRRSLSKTPLSTHTRSRGDGGAALGLRGPERTPDVAGQSHRTSASGGPAQETASAPLSAREAGLRSQPGRAQAPSPQPLGTGAPRPPSDTAPLPGGHGDLHVLRASPPPSLLALRPPCCPPGAHPGWSSAPPSEAPGGPGAPKPAAPAQHPGWPGAFLPAT